MSMTGNNNKNWYENMRQILSDSGEEPGVIGIRADLCSQIIMLPVNTLFELCQDLGTGSYQWLEKPGLALTCSGCKDYYGTCTGDREEIDYEQCQKRFWKYANLQAQYL